MSINKGQYQLIDITGQKFNKVTVVSFSHMKHSAYWDCLCDCGNLFIAKGSHLKRGETKSCGCWHKTKMITHGCTVGHKKTPEFSSWRSMINRCNGYSDHHKKYYKNVVICERWIGGDGFNNFIEDMGLKPTPQHTIDRIENDKGYYKENCKWSTRKEQANNVTRNHAITYNGETMNIGQWGEKTGLKSSTIWNRIINLKWSIEKSLSTPLIPNTTPRKQVATN